MPQILRTLFFLTVLTVAVTTAVTSRAQWTLQDTHTTADLRGIDNLGGGVAWASGSNGTILRTEDAGFVWQLCAKPPNGEHLDFRAIQAFDNNTAIIMSIGKGDQSRLYKTTDGCQTWTLLFTNPDKDGFFDALRALDRDRYEITGDSVDHELVSEKTGHVIPVWEYHDGDDPPAHPSDHFFELAALPKEGSFAASNSTLIIGNTPHRDPVWSYQWLASQAADHSFIHREAVEETPTCEPCRLESIRVETPMSQGTESAGVFSLAFRVDRVGVAVGGDYAKPDAVTKTAIYSTDSGKTWTAATTPPHGFRSAVAYDTATKTWITVGPNGTDISTDDGRNWRPLKPNPKFNEPPDADQHWNALSLPYVVGPHGRIATLRPSALKPSRP